MLLLWTKDGFGQSRHLSLSSPRRGRRAQNAAVAVYKERSGPFDRRGRDGSRRGRVRVSGGMWLVQATTSARLLFTATNEQTSVLFWRRSWRLRPSRDTTRVCLESATLSLPSLCFPCACFATVRCHWSRTPIPATWCPLRCRSFRPERDGADAASSGEGLNTPPSGTPFRREDFGRSVKFWNVFAVWADTIHLPLAFLVACRSYHPALVISCGKVVTVCRYLFPFDQKSSHFFSYLSSFEPPSRRGRMGGIGKQNRTPVGEKTPQKASIRDESIFTTIVTPFLRQRSLLREWPTRQKWRRHHHRHLGKDACQGESIPYSTRRCYQLDGLWWVLDMPGGRIDPMILPRSTRFVERMLTRVDHWAVEIETERDALRRFARYVWYCNSSPPSA